MKKAKRGAIPEPDERRPTKPAAPEPGERVGAADSSAPTYPGPGKTAEPPAARRGRGAGRVKPDIEPAARRPRRGSAVPDHGDQQPPMRRRGEAPSQPGEQYVRLRVRVRDGQLSVIDSHLVDGPLAQASRFPGTNAYEVTLGDRLLHAGALPDLGVQRSFVNPGGPPEQRGHHIAERGVYEFMARVPAHELTPDTIGQIAVRLHRVKEEAGADRLSAAPLGAQFEREVRPVAELVGLPDSVLPEAIERRGGRTPTA